MAQLMPLPLTVSCFSKIQIGFTFLVPAYLVSPGQRAVKRVCSVQLVTLLLFLVSDFLLLVKNYTRLIKMHEGIVLLYCCIDFSN